MNRRPSALAKRASMTMDFTKTNIRGEDDTDIAQAESHSQSVIESTCAALSFLIQNYPPSVLSTMTVLTLAEQELTNLPSIPHLKLFAGLQVLNLSGNNIREFHGWRITESLPNLRELDVSSNRLDSLLQVSFLGDLPHLSSLDLRDNPLPLIDHRIYLLEALFYTKPPTVAGAGDKTTSKTSSDRAPASDSRLGSGTNCLSPLDRQRLRPKRAMAKKAMGSLGDLIREPCAVPRQEGWFQMLVILNGQTVTFQEFCDAKKQHLLKIETSSKNKIKTRPLSAVAKVSAKEELKCFRPTTARIQSKVASNLALPVVKPISLESLQRRDTDNHQAYSDHQSIDSEEYCSEVESDVHEEDPFEDEPPLSSIQQTSSIGNEPTVGSSPRAAKRLWQLTDTDRLKAAEELQRELEEKEANRLILEQLADRAKASEAKSMKMILKQLRHQPLPLPKKVKRSSSSKRLRAATSDAMTMEPTISGLSQRLLAESQSLRQLCEEQGIGQRLKDEVGNTTIEDEGYTYEDMISMLQEEEFKRTGRKRSPLDFRWVIRGLVTKHSSELGCEPAKQPADMNLDELDTHFRKSDIGVSLKAIPPKGPMLHWWLNEIEKKEIAEGEQRALQEMHRQRMRRKQSEKTINQVAVLKRSNAVGYQAAGTKSVSPTSKDITTAAGRKSNHRQRNQLSIDERSLEMQRIERSEMMKRLQLSGSIVDACPNINEQLNATRRVPQPVQTVDQIQQEVDQERYQFEKSLAGLNFAEQLKQRSEYHKKLVESCAKIRRNHSRNVAQLEEFGAKFVADELAYETIRKDPVYALTEHFKYVNYFDDEEINLGGTWFRRGTEDKKRESFSTETLSSLSPSSKKIAATKSSNNNTSTSAFLRSTYS
eukprot:GILJ01007844.1.p1 GENE.GILJ01007844.1~~GILJ01007844.1.p1  ORF type:complete len:879 (+),score=153.19 GILJ01007844.1:72-2708(+)